jgi:cysteinyl-tRNA synthetase
MTLNIYNSLSRRKEPFVPIEPGVARLYVCGMTVYDYCHLGHARVMVVFDTVARYLRHAGYRVTYVRNITDIDDKIIKRALEQGISTAALTERFIDAMHEDEDALGVLRPDIEPKATQSIDDMIAMIRTLIERGLAYIGGNGDVFYAVQRFPGYGKLSGKNPDELRAGERVAVEEAKRDPLDFVLWKMAKPGEPAWLSPWGEGRPGWHIECSAMATRCLGAHFDIHGGGMDLQFPHHENEIAQSEGATGHTFVNVWMHNGFVRVLEEKMSKSLGNFFMVREILQRYRPETVRFFILNSHYRSPLNYSDENLDEANAALTRLYTALRGIRLEPSEAADESYHGRFYAAMNDDFNTPEAIAVLFDLARELNRSRQAAPGEVSRLAGVIRQLGAVLGLLQTDPEEYFKSAPAPSPVPDAAHPIRGQEPSLSAEAVDDLIRQRLDARKSKDWATADRIRDQLKQQGILLEDTSGTTSWRRA